MALKFKIFAWAFLFVFLLSFASAIYSYDDYDAKWQLCSALNYSGSECDLYWENVSDFSNIGFNESEFYSKEEVEELFENWRDALNWTEILQNQSMNNSNCVTIERYENETKDMRDFLYGKIQNISNGENQNYQTGYTTQNNSYSKELDPAWFLVGLIIIVGIVAIFIYFQSKNKKQKGNPEIIESDASNTEKILKLGEEILKEANKKKNSTKKMK